MWRPSPSRQRPHRRWWHAGASPPTGDADNRPSRPSLVPTHNAMTRFPIHSHRADSRPRVRGPHPLGWQLSIPTTAHPPRTRRSSNPPIRIVAGPGRLSLLGTLPLAAMEASVSRQLASQETKCRRWRRLRSDLANRRTLPTISTSIDRTGGFRHTARSSGTGPCIYSFSFVAGLIRSQTAAFGTSPL